ncbi:MAG: thiamine pyrophosphate-dependent enzyme [Rickettsiales bacterium]|nr:thiamine pyrophosphate-dependent enzyme [Rickettsiales bacterium]
MSRSKHTIGSFLFDYLYKQGIKTAFGIPGDFVLPTVKYLEDSPITFMTMTHEPSVGFAADAYARVHGIGMCCVTYCVGGLNTLNSIACAYAEKSPVIVISGGPSALERKKDPLLHHKVRTFDTQRRIYEEITCANTILLDPRNAASEIMRVVETVKKECRPGYIEVPFDIVDTPISTTGFKADEENLDDLDTLDEALKETAECINKAKKPVILAGVELHRHGLTDIALNIARNFNIPIASTLLSKSVINETDPLYIGVYSGALSEPKCQSYVDSSDCVIMLGTFITDVFLGLYTSKLTRKKSILATTEEVRVGFHNYNHVSFQKYLEGLQHIPVKKRKDFDNPNPAVIAKPLASNQRSNKLNVESFFDIMSANMQEGSTLICDTGDALIGSIGIRTDRRSNFISNAYYLSMGFSVPACMGVMAEDRNNKVFVVCGDGAFQMTGMEISSIAKYKMNPIIFIINNDGYGTQRHIIDGEFNNIVMWDYAKLTDVIGYGQSFRVRTKGELDDAIKSALDSNELTVIEAVVPKDDCSRSLKRMGEELGKLRDKSKQA